MSHRSRKWGCRTTVVGRNWIACMHSCTILFFLFLIRVQSQPASESSQTRRVPPFFLVQVSKPPHTKWFKMRHADRGFFLSHRVKSMFVKYLPTSCRHWTLRLHGVYGIVNHRLVLWLRRLLLLLRPSSHLSMARQSLCAAQAYCTGTSNHSNGGWQRLHWMETRQSNHTFVAHVIHTFHA